MDLFKILFNFGDNYYENEPTSFLIKMFTTVIPIFFSGLISFAITYYMFYKQNQKKDDNEKKRLSELKDYIFYCLDALIKLIDLQISSLNERIGELMKDVNPATYYALHRPLIISVGLNLKQIEKLTANDTFKILVTDKLEDQQNIKNYQFLTGSGQQLEKISEQLYDTNDWGSDTYEKYLDLIRIERDKITEIIQKLSEEYMKPQDEKTFRYFYLHNIIIIWQNYVLNNKMFLEDLRTGVNNLMSFCLIKNEEDSPYDEIESKIILVAGQKLNEFYDIIIQNKLTQIENFKIWVKDLEKIKKVYKDIINRIYSDKINQATQIQPQQSQN
jgi:hypothetical protein